MEKQEELKKSKLTNRIYDKFKDVKYLLLREHHKFTTPNENFYLYKVLTIEKADLDLDYDYYVLPCNLICHEFYFDYYEGYINIGINEISSPIITKNNQKFYHIIDEETYNKYFEKLTILQNQFINSLKELRSEL